jgi:hypothetical protein
MNTISPKPFQNHKMQDTTLQKPDVNKNTNIGFSNPILFGNGQTLILPDNRVGALYSSSSSGDTKLLEDLIDEVKKGGFSLNEHADTQGWGPVHYATSLNHLEWLKLFHEKGTGNLWAPGGPNHQRPIDIAKELHYAEIVSYLTAHPASNDPSGPHGKKTGLVQGFKDFYQRLFRGFRNVLNSFKNFITAPYYWFNKETSPPSPPLQTSTNIINKTTPAKTPKPCNAKSVANEVANTLVGNPHVNDAILNLMNAYNLTLQSQNNPKTPLTLWLEGEGCCGKSLLIHRLNQALNPDEPDKLINLSFGGFSTVSKVLNKLKEAQPLKGKIISLDDFQKINHLDGTQQKELFSFLNLLLSSKEKDIYKLQTEYGLDFSGVIVVFSSLEPFNTFPCFAQSVKGKELLAKISFIPKLKLNPNLRSHIPELVAKFIPQKLYQNIFHDLGDNIIFTPGVQEFLTQKLEDELERTQKKEVSGLWLVSEIGNRLKDVIFKAKYTSGQVFPMDSHFHYIGPLVFRVEDKKLIIDPPVSSQN